MTLNCSIGMLELGVKPTGVCIVQCASLSVNISWTIIIYIYYIDKTCFLLLVFDDFESSLTILSLVHLVFIMGSDPLDMSLKRVSAMDYNSF